MGRQIVKQPNGKYACWSTIVDNFIIMDMTEDEYIEYCAQKAYNEKEKEMKQAFKDISEGRGELWLKDYQECLKEIKEEHGNEKYLEIKRVFESD